MKLHVKSIYGDEEIYPLETKEDFKKVIEDFPQLHETIYRHHDFRNMAKEMADYLSNHHMDAWISDQ